MLSQPGTTFTTFPHPNPDPACEPLRLTPTWFRARFLALFSLLGEEMIGDLATPRRAAREAGQLLTRVADFARTLRYRKQLAAEEEERLLRAEQSRAARLHAATKAWQDPLTGRATNTMLRQQEQHLNSNNLNPSSSSNNSLTKSASLLSAEASRDIQSKKPPPVPGDPVMLFPNHLAMFDSEEEAATAWSRSLRRIFCHSLISPEDRQRGGYDQMSDDEFHALPLPPDGALPNETQLEACARRIFWVERIAAFYVAANVSVPRDLESVDAAVGQLLLEGNSYEEIWSWVQGKYGVYVFEDPRTGRRDPNNRERSAAADEDENENDDLSKLSVVDRAHRLLEEKRRQDEYRRQQNNNRPITRQQQQFRPISRSISTQTYSSVSSLSNANNNNNTNNSNETRRVTILEPPNQQKFEEEPYSSDQDAVEQIAARLLREMEAAGVSSPSELPRNRNSNNNNANNNADEDDDIAPPPFPENGGDDDDEEDIEAPPPEVDPMALPFLQSTSLVPKPETGADLLLTLPQTDRRSLVDVVQPGGGAMSHAPLERNVATHDNNQDSTTSLSPDERNQNADELKIAAMLLSGTQANNSNNNSDVNRDDAVAFDATKLMIPMTQRHSATSTFLPLDLRRRIHQAQQRPQNQSQHQRGVAAAVTSMPMNDGRGDLDKLRKKSQSDEIRRRAVRLKIVDENDNNNEGDDFLPRENNKNVPSSSSSSFRDFDYDDHVDPVTGHIHSSVIRALSSTKPNEGDFMRRLKSLQESSENQQQERLLEEARQKRLEQEEEINRLKQQYSIPTATTSHQPQQQEEEEQDLRLPAAFRNASASSSSTFASSASFSANQNDLLASSSSRSLIGSHDEGAGVFRCSFHVSGVVRQQLVSHMNMPTAALLALLGDFESAVAECHRNNSQNNSTTATATTSSSARQHQLFQQKENPIRALVLKCLPCEEQQGSGCDCVEVVVALTGKGRPLPFSVLRDTAAEVLATMAGRRSYRDRFAPLRLRSALGYPAEAAIVNFVVHDLAEATNEAKLLEKSSSVSAAAAPAAPGGASAPAGAGGAPTASSSSSVSVAGGGAASSSQLSTSSAAAADGDPMSHRNRLIRFYQKYDASKIGNVDTALANFANNESELWRKLTDKYGPEPDYVAPAAPAATTTPSATLASANSQVWAGPTMPPFSSLRQTSYTPQL